MLSWLSEASATRVAEVADVGLKPTRLNLTAKYDACQFNRQNHLRVGVRACGTVCRMHEARRWGGAGE